MPPRKRSAKMAKENKKEDYAVQSPKDFDDESVDDMLANVDQFIQGVYRDLSITPPQRASLPSVSSSSFTARRSLNESSSNSSFANNSPTAGSSTLEETLGEVAAVISPSSRRNMAAEIERINRICDNVDQNLRSIGVFMNNSSGSNNSQDVLNSNLNSSPSSSSASTSLTNLTINSPIVATTAPTKRTGRPRRRSSDIALVTSAPVIDLSETHTQTPDISRQSLQHNFIDEDDDDVILVSANIHPVVDLCTPGGYQEAPRARSSINQRQLNRRRLTHADDDNLAETCCSGPSPIRRRRTENIQSKKSINTSFDKEESPSASGGDESGSHTPSFMCPVCMESCLQRQPTSTRCGHIFCKECIERAIRLTHKCPMCNTKISRSQIFRIYL